jgi:uncharacterized protein (TIGR02246 family)
LSAAKAPLPYNAGEVSVHNAIKTEDNVTGFARINMASILAVGFILFAAAAQAEGAADIIAKAKPAIEKASSDWLPAIQKEDAKTLVEAYAVNGIFVTSTGQSVIGKQAIEQVYKDRFAKAKILDGKIIEDGITVQGALIYQWGHADITAQANGTTSQHAGYYLTVWQRSSSGVWQIIRNLTF